MDVRRAVGAVGRALIISGTLILLFVVYQLWGTNLAERRSQQHLQSELGVKVPELDAPQARSCPASVATPNGPSFSGEAVALIQIPRIGAEKAVVEDVTLPQLKKGPGHYPTTPMPGQPGNTAIAGHRTTYGAPFFRLDEMQSGDCIFLSTAQGRFSYEVTERKVVSPDQIDVLNPTQDNRLTLTTCNPRFSASQRLVVVAALKGPAVKAPPTPSGPPPARDPAGLSGRDSGGGPAVAWGLAAALVGLLTWLAGRRWRRLPAYLIGIPVFLVVLFFFFENFSRLLPSNY